MNIKQLIKQNYYEKKPLSEHDIHKSRQYFIFENCMALGIITLASGAYLTGFANYMGASDEFNGIIAAVPAAAGVVQMFSSIVFEKMVHRKFMIAAGSFLSRSLLSLMFLIPLLIHGVNGKLAMLGIIYLLVHLILSFITPASSNWIVDLTPEEIRGRYFARRDAISLGFITVISFVVSKLMDQLKTRGFEYGGFLILGVIILLMTFLDTFLLQKIKEPVKHRKMVQISIKDSLLLPLKNRKYRTVIILFLLWNIGVQIGGPFYMVYMVTRLKLSYTYIMIFGLMGSIVRIFAAKYWGRVADNLSWVFVTKLSIAILAVCHFSWIFVTRETVWMVFPVLNFFGGIAWSGISLALFNIQFVMAPEKGRTIYLGASAALGGIVGFCSTLVGSLIVKQFKGLSKELIGIHIGNLQIVFILSGILLFIAAVYVHIGMPDPRKSLSKTVLISEFGSDDNRE